MDKVRSQFVPNQKKQNKHLLPTIKKPLLGKGFNDDSDWAQTSDLYPVKVNDLIRSKQTFPEKD